MAQWVRSWHFLTHDHTVQKVGGSNPGCGTIVGGIFHLIRQLTRFSPLNMPSFKIAIQPNKLTGISDYRYYNKIAEVFCKL